MRLSSPRPIGARILTDPGNFSAAWRSLTDLDAVLVTHQHPDHLDPQNLPALLAANPSAMVLMEPSILDLVSSGELPSIGENAAGLAPDTERDHRRRAGDCRGWATCHHPSRHSRIGNVGYVLRSEGEPTLFHPGDALATRFRTASTSLLSPPTGHGLP